MRVICIKEPDYQDPLCTVHFYVGKEATVAKTVVIDNGEQWYVFAEVPTYNGDEWAFNPRYFAPLSDIDETQLINKEYATEQSTDTCTAQLHDTSSE